MKIAPAILRLFPPRLLVAGLLGVIGVSHALPALAGVFSVTPVRIFIAPKERAAAITITNDGDEELVMQADIFEWKQKSGGEDDLTLSEDLFLSPPIIRMAPQSRQVVRLALLNPPKEGRQRTYRMIVREIPEARPPDQRIHVQIALAFSMPVFVTPPGAKRALTCTAERASASAVKVTCENTGNAYTQIRELSLATNEGANLAGEHVPGGYILPDVKRSFELKAKEGRIPFGKAKLTASLDDGTSESYEVSISE
jgi:fimbrial chaperone protein